MKNGIPQGWRRTMISEVAKVFLGKTPAKADYTSSGNLKVVKFRDLRDGCVDFYNSKNGFVRGSGGVIAGLRELRRADVLITSAAHSGENIGKKCAYVSKLPAEFERIFFTGELLGIRCEDETLSRWIYLFFRSTEGFTEIQKAVTGVHLTGGRAKQMTVPLAPSNEQRRIVAKLEELLAKVDTCQNGLAKIPVLLKRFRRSILAAACSGRLTADWREKKPDVDGWPTVVLKEVADLRLGKMLDKAKNVGEPTRYLRNINVRWFAFGLSDLALMRATAKDKKGLAIRNGDLLICEGGEPGRCAIWNSGDTDIIFQKAIHRVRLVGNTSPHWLALNIRNDANSGRLDDYFTGTTIKHLTGKALARYEFPLPPLSEQQEIVRRVEALFALADQIEARCTRAKAHADNLTQSILAKAFRGELVHTDLPSVS